jgi:hypothetical protein
MLNINKLLSGVGDDSDEVCFKLGVIVLTRG